MPGGVLARAGSKPHHYAYQGSLISWIPLQNLDQVQLVDENSSSMLATSARRPF